jgi:ribosome recycling factor
MTIIDQTKSKMALAIEHLKNELKSIRTGRANSGMLDNIYVEVYGAQTRLKDIASVTTPEPRQLLITPFDRQNNSTIGKAIEKANLGFMPIVDGNCIRIKISPMDDAMRKEMVKLCNKRCEESKVSIRNIRRESNEALKKQKTKGEVPEDLVKKIEKEIQEMTDKFCKESDEITSKKEKEITTI